jgi:glycosyltransferase involved in cell wall biosynthesis
MTNRPPPKIGILLKTYPKISETFVLREILGLEQLALPLHIFSLQPPTDAVSHAANASVNAPVSYVLGPAFNRLTELVGEQARLAFTSPGRYLRALRFALGRGEDAGLSDFLHAGSLALAARRAGVAHIHAHFATAPAGVAELAHKLAGVSFSISAHAKDIYLSSPAVLRRKLAGATFTITCTEYNRRHLVALGGASGRVQRMYHGVDIGFFCPAAAACRRDPPLILSVGRLREKKGFATLIEACAQLAKRGVGFECEIVGYGQDAANLQALINARGLSSHVRLLGKLTHEQLIQCYQAASVFALPCQIAADGDRDGIPNVLLEAMATELPVVSTDVSGIPEVVTHGITGLVVPPQDASALAASLAELLADRNLRMQLGKAGRAAVVKGFSNDANLQLLRELLLGALARQQKSGSVPMPADAEIAYILKGFPRLSETFIANEIHLLENMGMKLRLFSIKPGDCGKAHGVVGRIRAPIFYLPEASSISQRSLAAWLVENFPRFAAAHWRVLKQSPGSYLATLTTAVAMSWRYRAGSILKPRKVFIKEFIQAGAITAKLLERPGVRHLHGHFCHGATTVTWLVSRMTGLPFSFTAHAKDIYQRKLNPGDLLARKLRAARFIATCTAANSQYLKEVCPECEVVHTIYHGLDTESFVPAHEAPAEPQAPLVLSVGRFVEKKGFSYLVEACARLIAQGTRLRCLIVGEGGAEYARIKGLIEASSLQNVISLKGPVSQAELRQLYAAADLFVLPCQVMDDGDRDGIPNVLAEAMAVGLPVVSTAISGIPELVAHGHDGLLVPERDSLALATAMQRLLASPQLRADLGRAARAKICTVFDSRKTTLRLKDLFLAAVQSREVAT